MTRNDSGSFGRWFFIKIFLGATKDALFPPKRPRAPEAPSLPTPQQLPQASETKDGGTAPPGDEPARAREPAAPGMQEQAAVAAMSAREGCRQWIWPPSKEDATDHPPRQLPFWAHLLYQGLTFLPGGLVLIWAGYMWWHHFPRPLLLSRLLAGLFLSLAWGLALYQSRHLALHRVAAFVMEIFDLRERGSPLRRYLMEVQTTLLEELEKRIEKTGDPSLEAWIKEARAQLESIEKLSPLVLARRYLSTVSTPSIRWKRFGFQRVTPRIEVQDPVVARALFHPALQQAIWMGGRHVWVLHEQAMVVLEAPRRGYLRFLQGPTHQIRGELSPYTSPKSKLARLFRRSKREVYIPSESPCYNRLFETLHRIVWLASFSLHIKEIQVRTRDGIPLTVKDLRVTVRPRVEDEAFLRFLMAAIWRHGARPHQLHEDPFETWLQELRDTVDGTKFLQDQVRGMVISSVRRFFAAHTLEETGFFFSEEDRKLWELTELRLYRLPPPPKSVEPEALRLAIQQNLDAQGFDAQVTSPQVVLPKPLQQENAYLRSIAKQLRQLQRNLWEQADRAYQAWLRESLEDFYRNVEVATPLPTPTFWRGLMATGLNRMHPARFLWFRMIQQEFEQAEDMLAVMGLTLDQAREMYAQVIYPILALARPFYLGSSTWVE